MSSSRLLRAALMLALSLPLTPPAVAGEPHARGEAVKGSGKVAKERRTISDFRRLDLRGKAEVRVRVGKAAGIMVAAEDNILPHLVTEVRGQTLVLSARRPFETTRPIRIAITVPDLEAVRMLGSGTVTVEGVDNERLAIAILGSGVVRVSGRTDELMLAVHGTGKADVEKLTAASVQVAIKRSGGARVRPSVEQEIGL